MPLPSAPPGAPVPPGGPGALSTRTDQAAGQPIRVPTGTEYGQAKALEQAQSAVPLPSQGPAGSGGPPFPSAPGPAQPTQYGVAPAPSPTDLMDALGHPTERPNEHILSGVGGGPQPDSLGTLLQQVAMDPNAPSEVKDLANYAASGRR